MIDYGSHFVDGKYEGGNAHHCPILNLKMKCEWNNKSQKRVGNGFKSFAYTEALLQKLYL